MHGSKSEHESFELDPEVHRKPMQGGITGVMWQHLLDLVNSLAAAF